MIKKIDEATEELSLTTDEVKLLKDLVDIAAKKCGGGEDTIGAIMYRGGFHFLEKSGNATSGVTDFGSTVAKLSEKIDCYEF